MNTSAWPDEAGRGVLPLGTRAVEWSTDHTNHDLWGDRPKDQPTTREMTRCRT